MSSATIVTYHYVRDLKRSSYPRIKGLDVDLFKEQLKYIRKHYNVIKMQDLLAAVERKENIPKNSLLLTFDDGYKDHFDFVFPVLDSFGMQGTFFVPGKAIMEHEVLDVNKIHFILAACKNPKTLIRDIYVLMDRNRKKYNLKENSYYHRELYAPGRFDVAEVAFIKRLLQEHLPEKLRKIIVSCLFSRYVKKDEATFSEELYMSEDQIKCLLRHGMYIGSHGWDHCRLDVLSEQRQKGEIASSLKFLDLIGSDTSRWVICYPHGAYSDSLITVLKDRGCRMGFTTKARTADIIFENALTFPRLDTNDLPKSENV